MQGYREYLVACAREVALCPCDVTVILAGGKTSSLPISEAESVLDFFNDVLNTLSNRVCPVCNILLEDGSVNAPQNILFSLQRIKAVGLMPKQVVICSDAVRRFSIRVVAWRLLRGEHAYLWKVCGFKRADIHPNSTWRRQLFFALGYLLYPKKLRERLRIAGR